MVQHSSAKWRTTPLTALRACLHGGNSPKRDSGRAKDSPLTRTTNKMAEKGTFWRQVFLHGPVLCLRFTCCIGLSIFTVILVWRYHWYVITTEKFARKVIPSRHTFAVFSPRLAGLSQYEPFTWQKDSPLEGCLGQVDRVPREDGLPSLACKRSNAFSKETYEKLALLG